MEEIKDLEKIMKALANRRRLAILQFLKKQKLASVSQVARKIKLSVKSTSKHLSILATVNIIEREQRSLNVYYSLASYQKSVGKCIISLI
jgi:DNA-binding transcriptional ArsR family regulator